MIILFPVGFCVKNWRANVGASKELTRGSNGRGYCSRLIEKRAVCNDWRLCQMMVLVVFVVVVTVLKFLVALILLIAMKSVTD